MQMTDETKGTCGSCGEHALLKTYPDVWMGPICESCAARVAPAPANESQEIPAPVSDPEPPEEEYIESSCLFCSRRPAKAGNERRVTLIKRIAAPIRFFCDECGHDFEIDSSPTELRKRKHTNPYDTSRDTPPENWIRIQAQCPSCGSSQSKPDGDLFDTPIGRYYSTPPKVAPCLAEEAHGKRELQIGCIVSIPRCRMCKIASACIWAMAVLAGVATFVFLGFATEMYGKPFWEFWKTLVVVNAGTFIACGVSAALAFLIVNTVLRTNVRGVHQGQFRPMDELINRGWTEGELPKLHL